MTSFRRKLIEVALPLDAINRESAREKSIRHQPNKTREAVAYNSLVAAWPELERLSGERAPEQQTLGGAS